MRRKTYGLALAAIATLGPVSAFAGDREIAQEIMTRLKANRDAGELKNFTLDMKVDNGIVTFRGKVDAETQREIVLAAADGVQGVSSVVNELALTAQEASLVKPKATSLIALPTEMKVAVQAAQPKQTASDESKEFAKALAAPSSDVSSEPALVVDEPAPAATVATPEVAPVASRPATAWQKAPAIVEEPAMIQQTSGESASNDEALMQSVARALGKAKSVGHLRDFGVDVDCRDGVIELSGTAASAQQRELIGQIAGSAPGAQGVRNSINVKAPQRTAATAAPVQAPMMLSTPANARQMGVPARTASYGGEMINGEQVVPGSMVNHGPVSSGAPYASGAPVMQQPMMQQPMPMGPAPGAGAPRYDSPNLPNYAWPGYAAYPNYAAVSYPQQYSPSAFPYIGPFYPYPQVPLGWRKVSLEWDDGWWFLDFTDR